MHGAAGNLFRKRNIDRLCLVFVGYDSDSKFFIQRYVGLAFAVFKLNYGELLIIGCDFNRYNRVFSDCSDSADLQFPSCAFCRGLRGDLGAGSRFAVLAAAWIFVIIDLYYAIRYREIEEQT